MILQIRTLTSSLATLTREKSRLEAAFQEDRKKYVAEKRERERQIEALKAEIAQIRTQTQKDVEEIKSKLIVERHGREKDTANHALMIRELQKLLSDERRAKERLETDLHETRTKLQAVPSSSGTNAKYEARIRELESLLKDKTELLTQVQEQCRALSPEVPKLKDEIASLKLNHRRDLERAEARAEAAEDRTVQVRKSSEIRVNHLEARLQELSDTIGTYDRLRQHDQSEIERWKEKAAQFEASSRANSVSPIHHNESQCDEFARMDLDQLISVFQRLKSALIAANAKSSNRVDLEQIFIDPEVQKSWQKEYSDLKREFDQYKRHVGSPRSRSSSLLPEVDQEVIANLKTKMQDLESRAASLKKRNLELECENREGQARIESLEKSMRDLNESVTERELAKEQEFKTKYLNVERELQKQRERCLTLIAEKEDEVSMLKSNMELAFQKAFAANSQESEKAAAAVCNVIHSTSGPSLSRKSSRIEASDITDDLHSSIQGDGMVLHYVQEISLKDKEVGQLRRQVFDLESTMRELQMNAVAKEERYSEEIEFLGEEVARLKRMTSKEGANMEYLKNVVLNYMLSSDASSRDHMLKAIGAVLIFSPKEIRQIREYNASWWPQKTTQKKGHRWFVISLETIEVG